MTAVLLKHNAQVDLRDIVSVALLYDVEQSSLVDPTVTMLLVLMICFSTEAPL